MRTAYCAVLDVVTASSHLFVAMVKTEDTPSLHKESSSVAQNVGIFASETERK